MLNAEQGLHFGRYGFKTQAQAKKEGKVAHASLVLGYTFSFFKQIEYKDYIRTKIK